MAEHQDEISAHGTVSELTGNEFSIDYQPNRKGRNYDTYLIAGDVTIGGEPNTVGVVLIRRKNDSRFYLHEVTTTKNGDATPFQTGATEETSARLPGGVTSLANSIQGEDGNVNGEGDSVGAAPSGFALYSRMLNEYGAIAPGENPSRIVDVPRSIDRWTRPGAPVYQAGYENRKKDGRAEAKEEHDDNEDGGTSGSSSTSSSGTTVYVTATGSKYHRYRCQYLRESCHGMTLSQAKQVGYTACSRREQVGFWPLFVFLCIFCVHELTKREKMTIL